MIQIRYSSFETNSSSVHTLVIPKDQSLNIPKSVYLRLGVYDRENRKVYDTLNYIYTACYEKGKDELNKLFSYLTRKGVENIQSDTRGWGIIDHLEYLPLEDLFANENLLDRFIFGEDSYIELIDDQYKRWPEKDDYDLDKYDIIIKGN